MSVTTLWAERPRPLRRHTALAFTIATSFTLGAAGLAAARGTPDGFAELAEQVTPAVVNIATTTTVRTVSDSAPGQVPNLPFPPGSPFNEFFKRFFDQPGQPFGERPDNAPVQRGAGSGFIIDPSGYVVTNNHVAADATEIEVTLTDGSTYPARLIGRDEKTDLAVVKIDAPRSLPFVPWGDSDSARVGDWVMAVGNPFGLGGTVTAGIVSARNRDINAGPYDDFLQVDASINRGNSGGPLFNMNGEVIGINTAIFSPTGGSVGIGFSIPSNLAKSIVQQLRESGVVQRGWLGVQIQQVTDEIAESLGLSKAHGALVSSVQPDGPAKSAGVQPGDLIVKFDGQAVSQMRDLPRIVAETRVGKTVAVTVLRDGRERELTATIRALPSTQTASLATGETPAARTSATALGVAVEPLTAETRQSLGLDDSVTGVVVSDVSGDGARSAGLRRGDVISRAGGKAVTSAKDLQDAAKDAEDQGRGSVLLLVSRDGSERFIAVPLG